MVEDGATFHNRYLVNDQFTVALHNGMDICNYDGNINNFEMSLFGRSKRGCGKIARGYVKTYVVRPVKKEEVDMCYPYTVIINEQPRVIFSVNG
jgi:hypothetical protein